VIHAEFTHRAQIRHQLVSLISNSHLPGEHMSDSKQPVRITLTDDQKAQIRNQTGKDAEAVELSVSELEDRIAPMTTRQ